LKPSDVELTELVSNLIGPVVSCSVVYEELPEISAVGKNSCLIFSIDNGARSLADHFSWAIAVTTTLERSFVIAAFGEHADGIIVICVVYVRVLLQGNLLFSLCNVLFRSQFLLERVFCVKESFYFSEVLHCGRRFLFNWLYINVAGLILNVLFDANFRCCAKVAVANKIFATSVFCSLY
jgi:hypothetical protein